MLGFTIEVVSSSHTLPHIQESVLTFLNSSFASLLKNMSETTFSTYRRAIISHLQTSALSVGEVAEENWSEIEERRYHFTSKIDRAQLIPLVSLDEVRDFFQLYFLEFPQKSNPNRRVLVVQASKEKT
jgi:secreted Zn-dependent insulinase-like peptidase